MGVIKINGVTYGGGDNSVMLTQAEYDALVEAGTVDPTVLYMITDKNSENTAYAATVSYANTDSGLSATNVQDAIDELAPVKTSIGNIDNVTLTTSDNNKVLGSFVENGEVVVRAVGGITTQTVDGIVWSIRQIGNWYEMWADIAVDCSQITPFQWGGLYVYRNATSIYNLPILLTKKVIDFSYAKGNLGMWTVYFTDLGNREEDRTTADIIRPTTINATVVVHKYIKGYV